MATNVSSRAATRYRDGVRRLTLTLALSLLATDARAETVDELRAACGARDPALERVAEELATRRLSGARATSADELAALGRREHASLPGLRASVRSGAVGLLGSEPLALAAAVGGPRACGVASVSDGARQALALVVAPRLATLSRTRARARAGEWIDVDARLLVDATGARVIVLGPRGAPHGVPTSFEGGRVRARFSADRAGVFLAQIVADLADGPRPVAELVVRVGADDARSDEVPGDLPVGADDADDLATRVHAARAAEGLPRLVRDRALDGLAATHAAKMARAGRAAHDVGDGSPDARVTAVLDVDLVGENVAHAGSVAAAHRALWASPSHRENLLSPRFTQVGLGVARADDGTIFVAELFAVPTRR